TADRFTEQADEGGLCHEHVADVAAASAKGFKNPDLAGALQDRRVHRVDDSEAGYQESHRGDPGQAQPDEAQDLREALDALGGCGRLIAELGDLVVDGGGGGRRSGGSREGAELI